MHPSPIHKTRRNLPHWTQAGAIYWINFRLTDSIPKSKINQWQRVHDAWLRFHPQPWNSKTAREYQINFGDRYEDWLDAGYGSCVLKREDCREIVKACLFRFQKQRLRVHHAVIMPNHVHMLMEPLQGIPLSKLMQGIKGASSREINRILGRSGKFWMPESYDHIVRNEAEYRHFLNYIDENPVKAGIPKYRYWIMPDEMRHAGFQRRAGFQPDQSSG